MDYVADRDGDLRRDRVVNGKRGHLARRRIGLGLRPSSRARELISSTGSEKTIFLAEEAIFREPRRRPEMIRTQD